MSYVIANQTVVNVTASTIAVAQPVNISQADSVCYQLNYSDATPLLQNFVAANVTVNPANTITITAHGFFTGLKVALSGTNLPTGLSATNYWVIRVDANTIQLASSLVNANAGTAVHITGQGTTSDAALTPATLSQVAKLQQSNDGITYFDVSGLTVTITGAGNTLWLVTSPPAFWHQLVVTPTGGALTLAVIDCIRVIVNQ